MPLATAKPKLAIQDKAIAFFHVAYGHSTIEKENGIIRGVKLMEVNRDATFAGPNGKAMTVRITPAHIDALLGHAGNRSIPIHYGHDWHDAEVNNKPDADRIEMDARIGALKSFRKDDGGSLIGDAYLRGEKLESILWSAEHNPEDTMFSAVFNYSPNDAQAMPLNFRAADIVPQGAGVTALFSEATETSNTMDDKEFLAKLSTALKDESTKTAILALVKPEKEEVELDLSKVVTHDTIAKLRADLSAEFETKKTALMAEVETKASAAATALLGKGGFIQAGTGDDDKNNVEAKLSAYVAAGAKNRGVAIMRFAHDKPDEYNAAVKAGKL